MKMWLAIGAVLAVLAGIVLVPLVLVSVLAGAVSQQPAEEAGGPCDVAGANVVYASSGGKARLPVVGKYTYTSAYGMRFHPIHQVMKMHGGMDLVTGGGDIVAPQDATVRSVTLNDPGAGNFIVLDHGNGTTSRYLHLASVAVGAGDQVKMGQQIGVEGNTGGSTGAHLHFEILQDGQGTDPVAWLKKHGVDVPAVDGTGTAPSTTSNGSSSGDDSDGGDGGSSSGGSATAQPAAATAGSGSGGSGFDLPKPGDERKDSLHTDAMPIPAKFKKLYQEAGRKYGLPWELLAGVGMAETHHGRLTSASSAGALGPMQFMPATWASNISVDGDGDGVKEITNPADSIHSAANYLSMSGATTSAKGVKDALFDYNRAVWYGNDVLVYAHAYAKGGGVAVAPAGNDCGQVDAQLASNATTDCPASKSPAEKGLQPTALNGLRCGAETAPWVDTMHGVGERSGPSDHGAGNAVDFMIPKYDSKAGNERGWKLARWFRTNASKLGVTYVIYDMKIWNVERGGGWRPYTRYGDTPDDTLSHRDHVHVSFTAGGGEA